MTIITNVMPLLMGKAASWTPAQFASTKLQIWLDANAAATITQSAGLVSQWNDKSGNTRNAVQASGVRQPAYQATGFNGLPTLSFATSGTGLSVTSFAQPTTYFLVGVGAVNDISSAYRVMASVGSNAAEYLMNNVGTPVSNWQGTGGSLQGTTATNFTLNQKVLFGTHRYVAGDDIRVNGSVTGQTTAGGGLQSGYSSALYVGNYSSAWNNPWSGPISELVMIGDPSGAAVPSLADVQLVEGYLAWKWGLQANLPSGHPYKSAAP